MTWFPPVETQRSPATVQTDFGARSLRATLRLLFWCALAVHGVACGDAGGGAGVDGPVATPACVDRAAFGSGAMCGADSSVDLTLCGGDEAACSDGGLCFESAGVLACTCNADSDCAGYSAYVNAARTGSGQASLTPRCVASRCDADLDVP